MIAFYKTAQKHYNAYKSQKATKIKKIVAIPFCSNS